MKISKIIDKWAKDFKMIVNKEKSGIMYLKGKNTKSKDKLKLGYPIVNTYKYLGIKFNSALSLSEHISDLEVKLSKYKKMALILRLQGTPVLK